jgi:uncharacterized protein YdhG (YjbR/CyaY superfamily)
MSPSPDSSAIDEYILSSPPEVQALLRQIRQVVRRAVPGGEERISYGMPAMFQNGVVVYYAAFKRHIGLYPPVRDPAVRAQVAEFAGPKGNLQFPLSQPLPLKLIETVVRSRLADNLTKQARK